MAVTQPPSDDGDPSFVTLRGSGARAMASGERPAIILSDPTHQARFEQLGSLGRGASGVVYEVLDRERGARVALKVLSHADPEMLVSFKREFRALAGIVHKNLVQLYELLADGLTWFFTMDLVDGCDFLEWVRPAGDLGEPELDRERLAPAMVQLTEGLSALHAAGKVHRDLKPSNVLVDRQGRVVIVDFGLAVDRAEAADEEAAGVVGVLGTPAYMAPEQASGEPVGPAADVYALGVMLFEALTGRLPFASRGIDALTEKLLADAPRASALAPETPPDLDALCAAMLSRDAEARPSLAEVRARLGGERSSGMPRDAHRPSRRPSGRAQALVGREGALGVLRTALARTRQGAHAVAVKGTSGYGKSALVRMFLDESSAHRGVLVLAAKCYERESIPHKTLDGVVDALARLLEKDPDLAEAVVPSGAWALARLFPQVGRLPTASGAPLDAGTRGPHEIRELAAATLAEMLHAIAKRTPLVIFVDDLQWGDADGTALLRDVLARIPAARLLVVLAFRGEAVAETPWLGALLDATRGLGARLPLETVSIGPLTFEECEHVVRGTLTPELAQRPGLVERIAEESQGNPFFLGEIVRHALATGGEVGALRLAAVVRARVDALPGGVAGLIEAVAVAGRPLSANVAFRVSQLAPEMGLRAVAALQSATLLRSAGAGGGAALECVHDRVRESLVETLGPDTVRRLHARLAEEIAHEPDADPEDLATHYAAAGAADLAREHFLVAARRAVVAVALDRAADLYREVLTRLPPGDARERVLRLELGDALANAARGGEAAVEYLAVARATRGDESMALKRRAGEELLFAGHVDRGTSTLAEVLAETGVPLHLARVRVMLVLVALRLYLRVRAYRFRRVQPEAQPPLVLARIDALIAVAGGLSTIDNVVAAAYAAWALAASLRAGDEWRICRMLCLELQLESTEGVRAARRVERMRTVAEAIAVRLGRPETTALVRAARGNTCLFNGRWQEANEHFTIALEIYERFVAAGARATEGDNFTARWETDTFRYFLLGALFQLGRWREMTTRYEAYARDAQRRGDLYLWANLQAGDSNQCHLFRDDPAQARAVVLEALGSWSRGTRFQMQHWYAFQSLTSIDLYEGKPDAALDRIDRTWRALERSFLLRIEYTRVRALHLRARAEVLAGSARDGRPAEPKYLARAERTTRRLLAEQQAWGKPLARLVLAAVRRQYGDVPSALALLVEAEAEFVALEMPLWAAAARERRGGLLGGDGAQLRDEARRAFAAEEVKNVPAMVRLMAPALDA